MANFPYTFVPRNWNSSITAYIAPSHFTRIGMINMSSTCASGKVAAYARNIDILM